MSIMVRRAVDQQDYSWMAELRWNWMREGSSPIALTSFEEFRKAFASWADAHAASHRGLLAMNADAPAGMAWLAVQDRVPGPSSVWDRRSGDLQSVYVLPELRDLGVGALLVDAALEEANSLGLEHVTVHASSRSVPFYERNGFRQNARLLWADGALKG